MKKLIAGLFAATMLAAGLVSVSGGTSPANAACTPAQYSPNACPSIVIHKPAGVGTTKKSATKAKSGAVKTLKITFSAKPGTKATVTVTVTRPSGKTTKKTVKGVKANKATKIKAPRLGKLKGYNKITITITTGGVVKTSTYYVKVV